MKDTIKGITTMTDGCCEDKYYITLSAAIVVGLIYIKVCGIFC